MLTRLQSLHQEQRQAIGLTNGGDVVELLVAKDGSWTIIRTSPSGITCVVTAGEQWQPIDTIPGKDS